MSDTFKPQTRAEAYWGAMSGDYTGTVPKPQTKTDCYLAAMSGNYDSELPPPGTRLQAQMKKAAEKMAGGGEQNVEWTENPEATSFNLSISDSTMLGFVKSVVVPDTATEIGEGCFNGCHTLESVTIPGSVSNICAGAFNGCTALANVNLNLGLKQINGSAFAGCISLIDIDIPETVEIIQAMFLSGTGVESLTFRSDTIELQSGCLSGANALKKVYFTGTNVSLSSTSLPNENITDIYVPWAEDDERNANAPWGATNATIHYNYTGE